MVFIQLFNFSFFSVTGWGIDLDYCDIEWFHEDLQDLLELTLKKGVLFIIGDCNAKVGSQNTPGVTEKFGLGVQNEARLRECTSLRKHFIPTTQEKTLHRDITRWSIPKSD